MRANSRVRLGTLAVLAVAIACGVAIHQAGKAAAIRREIDAGTERLSERVSAGRAAEGRLPELREEQAKVDRELDLLLEDLPDCRGMDFALEGVRSRAASAGLDVSVTEARAVSSDFYSEERLSLVLRGEGRAIDAFLEAPGGGERLADVEVLDRRTGTATFVLTLYCCLDVPATESRALLSVGTEADGVWLPSFRRRLEERKQMLAGLRAEVSRLAPILREVDDFRDTRARLQRRLELVKHLRKASATRKAE